MQEFDVVRRGTARFSLGTLFSRITGLAREQVTAFYFGASPEIASFFMAYRLALLLRRFFGEGAFLGGFTPYYLQAKAVSFETAAAFVRDFAYSLLGVVLFGLVLFEGLLCMQIQGGGEAILLWQLIALMLPSLLFAFFYMGSSALLQSERIFFMPGAAPLMFNVVFMGAVFASTLVAPVRTPYLLAIGVTFGFFLQWLLLVPTLVLVFRPLFSATRWRSARFFPPEVRQVMSALGLTFLGIGAAQINSALDAFFARASSLSGPAYMHYASRLYQMPLSLIGIAFASALLPTLARILQNNQEGEFYALWRKTLLRIVVFGVPISLGLILLGPFGVNLVYGRGGFQDLAVWESTYCLWGYAVGLVPSMGVLVLTAGYSARRDFATPLKASLIAICFNIFLSGILVWGFQASVGWIALATSGASFLNGMILWTSLSRAVREEIWHPIRKGCVRIILATMACGGMMIGLHRELYTLFVQAKTFPLATQFLAQCGEFVWGSTLFFLGMLFFAWMFRAEDFLALVRRRSF